MNSTQDTQTPTKEAQASTEAGGVEFYLRERSSESAGMLRVTAVALFSPGLVVVKRKDTGEQLERIPLVPGVRVKGGFSSAKIIDAQGAEHIFRFYQGAAPTSIFDWLLYWAELLGYQSSIKELKAHVRKSIQPA